MEFDVFKSRVLTAFHLDLHSYKEKQLKRRLDSYLVRLKMTDYGELFNRMANDRRSYEEFLDYLTINVSEFFRDPQRFDELHKKFLPGLVNGRNTITAWSAACSNGSEPYSLAIIMDELGLSGKSRIIATDIDRQILEKAKMAVYARESLKNVSPARLERFFDRQGEFYKFKDEYKRRVVFKYHDLLSGNYENNYDLILCRNVTIYFTREAQEHVYRRFNKSLNTGGILFIGGSEMIFNYKELGFEKLSTCFYKKM